MVAAVTVEPRVHVPMYGVPNEFVSRTTSLTDCIATNCTPVVFSHVPVGPRPAPRARERTNNQVNDNLWFVCTSRPSRAPRRVLPADRSEPDRRRCATFLDRLHSGCSPSASCTLYSRRDAVARVRSRTGTSSASSGIWGRLSCAGWVVRVRVLRRALARGDLKRLQRFQEFVSVHVHLGTGVDNVVTDNVPSPWVRVKVYRPLDPGVPLTLAVALHEAAVSCRRLRLAARIKYPIKHRSPVSTPAACESRTPRCRLRSKSRARS